MAKKITIFLLLFLVSISWASEQKDAQTIVLKSLVEDGFAVSAVEGQILFSKEKACFSFVPNTDINGKYGVILSGQKIELLPSRLLDDIKQKFVSSPNAVERFRVWGVITLYQESNYLLMNMALPLSDIPSEPMDSTEASKEGADSLLPDDIFGKLSKGSSLDTEKTSLINNQNPNTIVAEQVGRFKLEDGRYVFYATSSGSRKEFTKWVVQKSAQLDFIPKMINRTPMSPKFRVAGIETNCNGENYILIQRVVRKYSYGNLSGV